MLNGEVKYRTQAVTFNLKLIMSFLESNWRSSLRMSNVSQASLLKTKASNFLISNLERAVFATLYAVTHDWSHLKRVKDLKIHTSQRAHHRIGPWKHCRGVRVAFKTELLVKVTCTRNIVYFIKCLCLCSTPLYLFKLIIICIIINHIITYGLPILGYKVHANTYWQTLDLHVSHTSPFGQCTDNPTIFPLPWWKTTHITHLWVGVLNFSMCVCVCVCLRERSTFELFYTGIKTCLRVFTVEIHVILVQWPVIVHNTSYIEYWHYCCKPIIHCLA